jgi:peptidoglycan/xylan/chitin deacetylase (PgdA/CDA1 family)
MGILADLSSTAAPAAACAAALGALAYGTFAPRSSLWGPVLSRAVPAASCGGVALTFDDGPTAGTTSAILDVLRDLNVQAAFFVIGANAARWPSLVERMAAEGHVVGNHTFDHPHFGVFRRHGFWRRQVEETDAVVERITGRRPALFRPPLGFKTWHVAKVAAATGHTMVTWTRRAFDTRASGPPQILARLVRPAKPGEILLLHDGVEPKARGRDLAATEAAVRPLVLGLRRRGLEPQRLDRLLGIEPYQGQSTHA